MDFKRKINTLLASRGMTQADLAAVLGYQTRQVNRAINGGHVSRRLKKQLADWADVEITFNKGGNGDGEDKAEDPQGKTEGEPGTADQMDTGVGSRA